MTSKRHSSSIAVSALALGTLLFFSTSVFAQTQAHELPNGPADHVSTVGGKIELKENDDSNQTLVFNGRQVADLGQPIASIDYMAKISGNDVLIINSDAGAGSACYGTYTFVTISPTKEIKLSDVLADSCDAKINSTPHSIVVTSNVADGRRTKVVLTTYTKDGVTQTK